MIIYWKSKASCYTWRHTCCAEVHQRRYQIDIDRFISFVRHFIGSGLRDFHCAHLRLNKVCIKWVLHELTDGQKTLLLKLSKVSPKSTEMAVTNTFASWLQLTRLREAIKNGLKRPVIVERSQGANQVLYSSVFNSNDPVAEVPTWSCGTVTGSFCKKNAIDKPLK